MRSPRRGCARFAEMFIALLLLELAGAIAMTLPWAVWRHLLGIAGTVLLLYAARWIFCIARRAFARALKIGHGRPCSRGKNGGTPILP